MSDPAALDKLCAEGRDAATFLTQYVVQAELNERGNYGEQPRQLTKVVLNFCIHLCDCLEAVKRHSCCGQVAIHSAQDSQSQKDALLSIHMLQSSEILCLHCAAMSVEPHHTESIAEEAALRPGKPK